MNPDSILNDKEGLAVSRNKILEAFEYEVDEYEVCMLVGRFKEICFQYYYLRFYMFVDIY